MRDRLQAAREELKIAISGYSVSHSGTMDPVTAAATITQLIGLFRQEKGARKHLSHKQFIEWLEYHRHEEIKELISHTFHLSTQVDEILKQDHKVILAKLDDVNRILLDILSRVEGLGGVAVCLVPDIGLSESAIGILRLLASSDEGMLILSPDGTQMFVDASFYAPVEQRFLHDDLDSLVAHGFLSPGRSDAGSPTYRIKRRGAKFIELAQHSQTDKS